MWIMQALARAAIQEQSPNQPQGMWSQATSFKDKVVGEIPGAYMQAFNFGDLMEDDAESDDEVNALR